MSLLDDIEELELAFGDSEEEVGEKKKKVGHIDFHHCQCASCRSQRPLPKEDESEAALKRPCMVCKRELPSSSFRRTGWGRLPKCVDCEVAPSKPTLKKKGKPRKCSSSKT